MNIELETPDVSTVEEPPTNGEQKKGWRKALQRVGSWLSHLDKDTWLDQMRGILSLMATVIATMTFNMALNPPGGIRSIKDDTNPSNANINAKANSPSPYNADTYALDCGNIRGNPYWDLCPGEAVLAVVYPDLYFGFLVSNTICFVVSLSVCLLLVSGIRLHHRLPMWLLSIGMCITLTSLALSYIIAVEMTTPSPVFDGADKFLEKLVLGWMGLLAIIGLCHTLRLVISVVKFFLKKRKNKSTRSYSSIARQRVN